MSDIVKTEITNFAGIVGDCLIGVPAVGAVVAMGRMYVAWNEQIFISKIHAFLKEVKPDSETTERFKLAIADDKDKFFIKLWTILDKLDDDEKATITGKLFMKVLLGKCSIEDFLEAADVVQKVYIGHLKSLKRERLLGDNKRASNQSHRFQLIRYGLIIESEKAPQSDIHIKPADFSAIGKLISESI